MYKKTALRPTAIPSVHTVQNAILLGLPRKEYALVFSHLMPVQLKLNDVVQRAGERIEFLYFPHSAMASVLNLMEDGKSVEVGLVGREGVVGLPAVAGFKTSPYRVITQGGGTASRIGTAAFQQVLPRCPQLGKSLARYSQEIIMQTTQNAACNRLHEVDERLARWLLMTHDRVASDELPLTQEFLSQMLGTRRASVSLSAGVLQKAGVISYIRGRVKILDRSRLEGASCECYGVVQRQLTIWCREFG